jgi:outer membrane protein
MMRAVLLPAIFVAMEALAFSQGQPPAPTAPAPPVAAPTASQTPAEAPAVSVRVATIFAQNAIVSTQEGQKAAAALAAKYDPKRRDFEGKQTGLQALRDRLKRGAATMSQAAKDELNRTIDAKYLELKRMGEDIQAQVDEEQGALLQELGEKLVKVIDQYAQENGLATVLDVSAQQSPILWAAPGIDITSEIVRRYDKLHPVQTTPPVFPPVPVKKQ